MILRLTNDQAKSLAAHISLRSNIHRITIQQGRLDDPIHVTITRTDAAETIQFSIPGCSQANVDETKPDFKDFACT